MRFLIGLSLGIGVLALAGCDDDLDYQGMDPLTCDSSGRPRWLSDIKPEVPATYVEIRLVTPDGEHSVLDAIGSACGDAADENACLAALEVVGGEGIDAEPSCAVCDEAFLVVVTRGDDVEVLDTRDEIVAFLGEIDTPTEAAWVSDLRGKKVDCAPGVREAEPGWEVAAHDRCGSDLVVRVTRGGSIEVVDEVTRECSDSDEDTPE